MNTSNTKNTGSKPTRTLETPSGIIEYPAYIPVTTFGNTYPLDALIQPYLPRLSPAVMVSFHYAQAMKKKPRIPTLIDSGGFAALFEKTEILNQNGLGILRIHNENETDELTPMRVLDFQELHADVAFTLDFPIPPNMDRKEADKRIQLTIKNAIWALSNRRRKDLRLFASIQGLKAKDYLIVARQLSNYPFDGFAIGGMVPRARDKRFIESVISGVRNLIGNRPLHIFGLGKPQTTQRLFYLGADSIDSSSYVKLAAEGKSWLEAGAMKEPAVTDRLLLALQNLKAASEQTPFGRRVNTIRV